MTSVAPLIGGLRHIRPIPDPLGLFLRVGRNDHRELLDLLARGDAQFFGLVFEAATVKRHKELRERALAARLDAILDPCTQAAATVGGHNEGLAALPWGEERAHRTDDFRDAYGRRRTAAIADFAVEHGFTQVLAPTHLVSSSTDPWLAIDCESTQRLRVDLDRIGASRVQICYSLDIPYALLRDEDERDALVHALRDVPSDAIWLRIEGLGSDATANGVRNYVQGATAFQALGRPLVADGIGGLAGLSLLAFGATGGIAHGITFGERVDHSSWRRPRDDRPFGRPRRVYIPDLDLLLEPEAAALVLQSSARARALLGCRDTRCCPRGTRDTLESPARHFLIQRMKQLGTLSRLHHPHRAVRFVDDMVRPASDVLVQAGQWHLDDPQLTKKLSHQRRRLDALRTALAADVSHIDQRAATLPKTRAAREMRLGL